jgi:hypothetical protein
MIKTMQMLVTVRFGYDDEDAMDKEPDEAECSLLLSDVIDTAMNRGMMTEGSDLIVEEHSVQISADEPFVNLRVPLWRVLLFYPESMSDGPELFGWEGNAPNSEQATILAREDWFRHNPIYEDSVKPDDLEVADVLRLLNFRE